MDCSIGLMCFLTSDRQEADKAMGTGKGDAESVKERCQIAYSQRPLAHWASEYRLDSSVKLRLWVCTPVLRYTKGQIREPTSLFS